MTIVKKRNSFSRFQKIKRSRKDAKKFLKQFFQKFLHTVFLYLKGNVNFSKYCIVALRISRFINNLQYQILEGDGSFNSLTGW